MKSYADAAGEEYVPFELLTEKHMVEMSKDQRALYNQLADEMFVTLPDGKIIWADNGLSKLTRLLQCASSMLEVEHVDVDPDKEDDDGIIVHMVKPSSKVDAVMEKMRDLPDGEPVIIFTVNRELAIMIYQEVEKANIKCSIIHGGIEKEQRDEEVLRFQEGASQVIVLTYATGAEGITLTRSRIQFRVQLSWSMILNEQSVGRNRRYGQTEKVLTYIDFITADSVESRVHEAYGDKLEALETIVQDAKRMKELVSGK
jgi:SNF2 family DNA or RNA helicase